MVTIRPNYLKEFRWHDLRHTWASWHVQNGTSLQELQQLGGWASFQMVLRYAHLSSEHLKQAAQRITQRKQPQVEPEGVNLQELQQSGKWISYQVQHQPILTTEKLQVVAQNVTGTNLVHSFEGVVRKQN